MYDLRRSRNIYPAFPAGVGFVTEQQLDHIFLSMCRCEVQGCSVVLHVSHPSTLSLPTSSFTLVKQFLPREATRSAVLPWHVVRLSVRLSVCDVDVS